MKKKDYEKPKSLIIDGEIVKFHYNRDERLNMHGLHSVREKTSFFSPKFRHFHILIVDLLIIAIIGVILTSFYGKSESITVNNMLFHITKKTITRNKMATFTLQIKNETSTMQSLPGNFLNFTLTSSEETKERELLIDKITFHPGEYYIDHIVFHELAPGDYVGTLIIDEKSQLSINIKM